MTEERCPAVLGRKDGCIRVKKFRPWTVTKEHSDHMAMRQTQNRARNVPAENWFAAKLPATNLRWTRQARWGFRLFDFWCHEIGIAIEIDGAGHNAVIDAERDAIENERSCIIVLRVRNFNEDDAREAIERVGTSLLWNDRRYLSGKKPIRQRAQQGV